jgi:hypothetical protein
MRSINILAIQRNSAADPGIDDDDLGAVRRHQLGNLGSDPARRPGADRDPSLKHAHRAALSECSQARS